MIEPLKILIVGGDVNFSRAIAAYIVRRIGLYSDKLKLEFVYASTLKAGLEITETTHATILNTDLADASTEAVISSIPKFRPPVIILHGEDDSSDHYVAEHFSQLELCEGIFYKNGSFEGLSKSVLTCLGISLAKTLRLRV